jgi:hypothetical protein
MNTDTIIGMLLALATMCTGALFVLLFLCLRGSPQDQGRRPDGGEHDLPPPNAPSGPTWEVPDHVPAAWVREAA